MLLIWIVGMIPVYWYIAHGPEVTSDDWPDV